MKWLHFLNGVERVRASSLPTSSNTSTNYGMGGLGSGYNSKIMSETSGSSLERSPYPSFSQLPNNLRIFTFPELKSATRNFSRSTMIGEGGFGSVYRGTIKSFDDPPTKIDIAVKQLNPQGLQGHKEWLAELNVLGVADHPNLVKLIGYCAEDDERGIQRLLVYEYMPNHSVEDHLFAKFSLTLSWPMRLRIALDTARGLTYLHEGMDFQIIFRDLKTSNILLDEEWNAKLSDFGLARHGPTEGSHVSTTVVGTIGYAAPEYIRTGQLTAKSDIWSYGVVLYELLTGRPPLDRNRPKDEQKLLEWVKPYLSDTRRFRLIMDRRLEGQYSLKAARRLSAVANRCLVLHPKSRPKMSEVLEMVTKIVENTEMGPPQPPAQTYLQKEGSVETKMDSNNKEGPSKDREKKMVSLKRRICKLKTRKGWWCRWCIQKPMVSNES